VAPLLRVDHPGVLVETVKLADDRSGELVIRLYEAEGTRSRARVELDPGLTQAQLCDLLERPTGQDLADVDQSGFTVELRPFQLVTVRCRMSPQP
jgi:alpha-mannosidase